MSKVFNMAQLRTLLEADASGDKYIGPNYECVETGEQVAPYLLENDLFIDKFHEESGETARFPNFARFINNHVQNHFIVLKGDLMREPGPAHDVVLDPVTGQPVEKPPKATKAKTEKPAA